MCDQLWYNALQRCFAIWPQPAAVGGPFLTDGRTNLLISPTIAEAGVGGVFGGLYEEPNSSTRCPLTVANKIKEPVRARVPRKMRGNQR